MLRGKCGGTRSSNVVSPEGASWGQAALLYVSKGGTTSHSVFSPKRATTKKLPESHGGWRCGLWEHASNQEKLLLVRTLWSCVCRALQQLRSVIAHQTCSDYFTCTLSLPSCPSLCLDRKRDPLKSLSASFLEKERWSCTLRRWICIEQSITLPTWPPWGKTCIIQAAFSRQTVCQHNTN